MGKLILNCLEHKEMSNVKGGVELHRSCGCSCFYKDSGGSSVDDNFAANFNKGPKGAYSTEGTIQKEFELDIELP